MKPSTRLLISLGLAAALLAVFFRWGGVRWSDLIETWRRLPLSTWTLALAIHLGVYVVRGMRFRTLIPPGRRPGLARLLSVSSAHNLAAYVLPAKTGEAAFVVYLRGFCDVPASEGIASLLVSRLLDLTTLCGGLSLACLAIHFGGGEEPDWLGPLGWTLGAGCAALVLLCARRAWLVSVPRALSRLLRLDRTKLGKRLDETAERLAEALRDAGGEGRLLGAGLLSVPLWLGIFLFYAVLFRGLGLSEQLDLARAAFGSGLAVVANLLPINGFAGFGTQEAGWVLGFGALGVSRDLALSTSLGVHLVQLGNIALLGLAGHVAMGLLRPSAGAR